jgi:hypothetical protein
MRRRISLRRAATIVQWCVVAAVITLVVVGSVALVGNRANNKLNESASDLTNPTDLTKRFGSSSNSNSNSNVSSNSNSGS